MTDAIWVNPRQPQTLYIAQILMYLRGVIAILFGGLVGGLGSGTLFGSRILAIAYILLLTAGFIAGAFGVANEKKWGYRLAVVAALTPLVVFAAVLFADGFDQVQNGVIGLLFDIALVALLLHDQSRQYQRIWFR